MSLSTPRIESREVELITGPTADDASVTGAEKEEVTV